MTPREGTRAAPWLGKFGARRVAIALLFFATQSCARPPAVELSEGPRSYSASDYWTVLRKWTRQKKLHSVAEMDNVLTVTSTYQSWDFRHAFASRYCEDYRLDTEERATFLNRSLAASKKYHEFYVALYAQLPHLGELHKKDALWKVRLVDDQGGSAKPLSISPVDKPSQLERTYFPYTTPHRKVFRITFEKSAASAKIAERQWFGLLFASAQGQTTLKWQLAP